MGISHAEVRAYRREFYALIYSIGNTRHQQLQISGILSNQRNLRLFLFHLLDTLAFGSIAGSFFYIFKN